MLTMVDRTTRREQEQVVINFVRAFIDGNPATMPDHNNPFWNAVDALALNAQAPKEQRQRTLENIRRHPQHKEFDSLLKRGFDPKPEDKQQDKPPEKKQPEETSPEWTTEYRSLPGGIVPDIQLEPIGVLRLMALYIDYSKELSPEGYKDFHELCFWSLLSTIAARRIYIAFRGKIYTSLYLAMVSKGSSFSKSETAAVVKNVINSLGLSYLLMPNKQTPQSMLSVMSGHVNSDTYERLLAEKDSAEKVKAFKRKLASSGQRAWISDEIGKFFSGMINQNGMMADFNSLLLELESSPERYENETIKRGNEPIEKPYISLLGCATPSNFRDNNTKGTDLWRDGTYHRFGIICPPANEYIDSPFKLDYLPVPPELIESLHAWDETLGAREIDLSEGDKKGEQTGNYIITETKPLPEQAITLSEEAYILWVSYRSTIRGIARNDTSEIFDGAYKRLAIRAVKMAALAASVENSSSIDKRHMIIALRFAEKMRESFHMLYAQVFDPVTKDLPEDKIIRLLTKKSGLTVREIAQGAHYDTQTVRKRLDGLMRDGEVTSQRIGRKQVFFINTKRETKKV